MKKFISQPKSTSTLYELWLVRNLVKQLIVRDLTVRYRQTILGWLWAVVNPAINLAMYFVVFGVMVRFNPPEYNVPYAWVLLCGLVLWMLFSSTVNSVGDSLLNNVHLIKKIYFPRIGLALAGLGVSSVDFIISLLILCALLLGNDILSISKIPLMLLCAGVTALTAWGLGCVVAILRLRFRDFRHIIPLFMQALFYATPVVWTPGLLPSGLKQLVYLNPLSSLIGLFRYALLAGPLPSASMLLANMLGCAVSVIGGYLFFIYYEAKVTDQE
ncbi:ABC transporter permease [Scandinavium goeteborgense]|uniref:ABC transporter permease n=1 Tax=Scandinavium goeteborgense TaxID=1851514 RepID=UPI000F664AC3|nr:ABC transporter permease [Scandinavium goeteborgense]QKN79784.1 ABC transporter permease [Scandinavium goeteborgense]